MSGQQGSAISEAAERYASAWFDLAVSAKATDAVEGDARAFVTAHGGSEELRRVLASPVVPAEQKAGALAEIAKKMQLKPLTANFFGVVAGNGRAAELSAMCRAFVAKAAKARGAVVAHVATAEAMSETQLADLKAALSRVFKAPVDVEPSVKPDLLGGLVVKVGSRLFDDSVKSKLDALKIAMKGA